MTIDPFKNMLQKPCFNIFYHHSAVPGMITAIRRETVNIGRQALVSSRHLIDSLKDDMIWVIFKGLCDCLEKGSKLTIKNVKTFLDTFSNTDIFFELIKD